jgi:hypothetical protein
VPDFNHGAVLDVVAGDGRLIGLAFIEYDCRWHTVAVVTLVRKRLAFGSLRCYVRLMRNLSHLARIASKVLPTLTLLTHFPRASEERTTSR